MKSTQAIWWSKMSWLHTQLYCAFVKMRKHQFDPVIEKYEKYEISINVIWDFLGHLQPL